MPINTGTRDGAGTITRLVCHNLGPLLSLLWLWLRLPRHGSTEGSYCRRSAGRCDSEGRQCPPFERDVGVGAPIA